MTSNFKMLIDYTICSRQDEIIILINEIESSLQNNNLDSIYLKGRKILETIFSDIYDDSFNLNDTIQKYTSENSIPTKVKNAFYAIRQKANEETHAEKISDKPFIIKKDIFSCMEFLKQIYIAIKHFIIKTNNYSSEISEDLNSGEYGFDSSLYSNLISNKDMPSSTNEDISPSIESFVSKTRGIFELICSEFSFLIPTYQRAYTWEEKNVEVFLQDILDRSKDKKSHYMGSLAISVDKEKKLLRLIDGQQRITTSLLLIKAIINFIKNSKTLKIPKELEDLSKNIQNKYINKTNSYGDISNIQSILSGRFEETKEFKNSTAYKNYMVIINTLNSMNENEVEEFYATFVNYFVIAELRFNSNLENEIQIFENLNSKGLELSSWDLIKNYIYKNIDTDLLLEHEHEIERSILNKMFILPASHYFGNKKYVELSLFFQIYCRLMHKLDTGKILNDKGKIHKIFQDVWPETERKFKTIIDLENSLSEIAKLFSIYAEIKSGNYKETNSALFELKLPIENTSTKDAAHYPLIIQAIYNNSKFDGYEILKVENKGKVLELLENIEKYIVRLIVTNNTGQSLSSWFDKLIDLDLDTTKNALILALKEKNSSSTTLPAFHEFRKKLREKIDWQEAYAKAILRRLEAISSNLSNKNYRVSLNSSLEHILPQKVDENSAWYAQFSNMTYDKFKKEHSNHIDKLGNYILLSTSINSAIKNGSFADKKAHYKKDSEAKLITGDFGDKQIMNLLTKDSFTFNDIDERTSQLADLIAPLYKFDFE